MGAGRGPVRVQHPVGAWWVFPGRSLKPMPRVGVALLGPGVPAQGPVRQVGTRVSCSSEFCGRCSASAWSRGLSVEEEQA